MANNKVGGENNAPGDIWLNMSGAKGAANLNDTAPGEDGYETILHELGHALNPSGGFGVRGNLPSRDLSNKAP